MGRPAFVQILSSMELKQIIIRYFDGIGTLLCHHHSCCSGVPLSIPRIEGGTPHKYRSQAIEASWHDLLEPGEFLQIHIGPAIGKPSISGRLKALQNAIQALYGQSLEQPE